ncbi:MAG TPA: hypothetical protein VK071_02570 [Tissierellales bacterium]|nr:hypothetical protein [Tissierellales bacterium]
MNMKHLVYRYILALAGIILSFIGLRKVIRKENLVRVTIFTIVDVDEMMKHKDTLNAILRVIIIVMCIFAYAGYIIPAIIDLPRAINGDFCITEGVAIVEKRYDDSRSYRTIKIKDKDGNKQKISCDYNEEINIGDRFIIEHLPNFKVGSVIEHERNTD